MSSLFERSIETLRGVGQKRGVLFRKLGVPTVGDLLELYPRAYEDWSGVPILETTLEQVCTVRATVCDPPTEHRIRGGRLLYKVKVTDGSDDMALTFFNNRYIPTLLKAGQEYLFHGKVQGNLTRREMLSPQFTPADRARPIVPVYPATAGLTSRQISAAVAEALQLLPETVSDPLPLELRERFHLCHLNFALEHVHFPAAQEDLSIARTRLIFEEFLVLQLGLLRKGGLDVPFMFLLNHLVGLTGIAWATPLADTCAMAAGLALFVPFWRRLEVKDELCVPSGETKA